MVLNNSNGYGTFAGYSATDTNRLFIRILDPTNERIYFGVGQRSTSSTWYFRVKDPNGNVIYGPTLVPTSGTGFINYHRQAILGPNVFSAQGYTPFTITPTAGVAGNYYIEFNKSDPNTISNNTEIGFGIFDITVGNPTALTRAPGRLFSYNWGFNTSSYANQFYGSFYIYGADSSVTNINMNGIKPYKFRISCNSYGTSSTGSAATKRRSKTGFAVLPELKLFLRDPDIVAFPSGSLLFMSGAVTLSGCTRDSLCISVTLVKTSDVTVLIDRNNNGVFNPGTADRKMIFTGVPAGTNCLPWDGKDGFGNFIGPGTQVKIYISVESGEVNLPIFDVESHPNGYNMTITRPAAALFVDSLFYDDVLVGGGTNLTGCAFPCHTWVSNPANTESNTIGNDNTINTYWFARKQSVLATLTMPDYLTTNAGPDQTICVSPAGVDTVQLAGSIVYSLAAYNGSFRWRTSGSGTFIPNDSTYTAKYKPSVADINAGAVAITLQPRYNCTHPLDSMWLTLNKRPTLSSSNGTVAWFGGTSGSIDLAVTNSNAPYTYSWSNGASTQDISGLATGSYTVTVTSSASCSSTFTTAVTQPAAALSGTIGAITNIACFGQTNGTIGFTASGGTSPYTYSWSNGSSSQNLSGVGAGTYTVTVTDSRGCTSVSAAATISGPAAALVSSITTSTNVSCRNGSDGTIDLNVTGGTSPYSYLWSNGATTQDISGLAAGTYSVTITDNNGCTSAQSRTITQPAAVVNVTATIGQQVNCFGGSNGSINLSVSGGTSPYTYLWSNAATTQDITGLVAGTYTVTVTDANGCTAQQSRTITQPAAALSAALTTSQQVNCFGGSNGYINITVSGGTGPYTYVWSSGATTQDLTGLGAGTYSVTVTDSRGCTFSDAYTISQPAAALSSSASVTQQVSCFAGSNGAIDVTVSGGTSPYSYSWSTGASTQDLSGLATGTYTITITDANNCTSTSSASVTQPVAALNASASVSNTVSCFGGADGQISLTVNGGTSPYSYVWSNGANTQNISGLTSGTYTVTITDGNGCTDNASATVTQPAAALSGSTTITGNISCFSGNNGSIDLTVAGGTGPFSYSWSNGATSQDLSGLAAGTYNVTITDARGCTATSSGTISQPAGALSTNINISQNIPCFGSGNGAIDLTVSGGTTPYSSNWSNGASTQDISGLAAGIYTVTITDANGCNATSSITITQPSAALSTSINANQPVLCFGGNNGSLTLNTTGGTFPYTYAWSNGQTSSSILNLTAGTYTVTVTDANGCTDQTSGTITQPSAALNSSATASQQVNCFGGSNGAINLTVSGGTSPYTYLWSNGSSTQNISGLSSGTFTVTITDANGCQSNSSATVTQPVAALNATSTADQMVSCFGGSNGAISVVVTGGTSPYTYVWSNGATTQNISGLTNGTYTVTVTDANGCIDGSSSTISQPAAALNAASAVTQVVSCFGGSDGSINVSVSGGTSPYSFLWSNGATTEDLSNTIAGTYTVTITDANGCTTTQSKTITQPAAALAATANPSINVLCFGGNNGAISLTVSGGTPGYNYEWNTGATSQNISGLLAGTYTVTVTDARGCTTSSSATITQPAASLSASANVSANVSCFGGNNGSINVTVAGGTSPYSYVWNNGATTQNVSGLASGSYTVTVTDANGCSASQTLGVSQPAAALNATATVGQAVLCFGGNNGAVNLDVTGGTAPYSYNWSNGASTQDINTLISGTYTVTVTDANGCTDVASATVTQPAAALSASTAVTANVSCFGGANGSINLSVAGGTAPYTYSWSNGAITQDINSLAAGTYVVTITDNNGCTTSASATITQPAATLAATANATQDVSCFGGANGQISLVVTGGTSPYSYQWNTGASTGNLAGVSAGNYTVTVTDANGCTTDASATVSQPDEPLAATPVVSQNVSCFGGVNGSISLSVIGGTIPYTYVWSNGATTQNINSLSSGTYTVTVTDLEGCTDVQSVVVSQPAAALSATASVAQQVSCFGGNNGSITLTVSGGTTPYSYSWSNGASTQNISGLTTGTYTVTITDANGCTTNQSATITQPAAALSGTTTTTANISCFSGNNGAIDLTVTGGTSPYSYNWSNGATTQDISGLAAGTYTVTITDANGCTAVATGVITQPAGALSSSLSVSQNVLCFSGNTGSLNLTVTGGTTPYTYIWNTGATTQDISGLSAGTYTVTVNDANGCNATQSATITQPSAALSASGTASSAVSCFGGNNGSVSLTVNGGTSPYTYVWNNGATTQNLSSLAAGAYTVTVTDANACTATTSVVVTQPAAALSAVPTVSSNVSCFAGNNGAISLAVSGGTAPYTFAWSNGSTNQNLSGLTAGTFTVLVTDANGCTANANATISQPAAGLTSSLTVSQNISCFGGSNGSIDLTLSGGTSPYSYVWSNGATTQDISGVVAGTYTVTITDANGCTDSKSATITQPAAALSASASTSQQVNCFGGNNGAISLTVSGGTSPYSYSWSNGASTQNLSGLTSGTYTVTVTDANGCTATSSATITQPVAALNSSITASQNVNCFGNNTGSIDISVTGGTTPYSYLWNNGGTTQDLNNLTAGTYSVTITDANGCTSAESVTITQPVAGLSSSIAVSQQVSCFAGANGAIDVTVSGGTTPYTYSWSNGASTQDLTGVSAGTYSVTITDANGCTSLESATINQPVAALSASASVNQQVNCFGGNNGSINLNVSGGTAPYSYNWSNGASSQNLSGLTAGTYNVTITDANGCTATSTATITQPVAALTSSAVATANISCFSGNNGSIDLTVSGGTTPYSFAWSNGATTEDISGLAAGTYTVTITDANGCTSTSSATITQPAGALSTSLAVSQNVSCFAGANGSLTLTVSAGTAPYNFIWNTGATTQNLSGLTSGTYTVTVTDANGCNSSQSATISQPAAALSAVASVSQQVDCFGGNNGSVNLTVSGGTSPYTYAWSNGASSQNLSGLTSGTYTVTVTDANGCTAVSSATVTQPSAALTSSISASQNVNCFGNNTGSIDISVSGGTSPYSYSWSNGANTQDITGLAAGTYSVTITDANGCTSAESVTISQPSAALSGSVAVTQQVSCFAGNNGSIDLSVAGGTTPYSYNWSNGATTQDVSGLTAGTYTVTVTDANGCTLVESATISQPAAALNANATVNSDVNCFGGNNGQISLAVTGGTAPYSYNWSNGQSTQNITNLVSGTYTVTVTDANGCTAVTNATVNQPVAALSASTTVTGNISCFSGNNGSVDLTVSGGTGPYTFDWSTGAVTEDLSGLSAGTYNVTITDANGCTTTASATIVQPAGALSTNIDISQNIPCFGGGSGAIDLTITGCTLPYNIIWSNGATTEDISGLAAGVYTVTITDANGCNTSASGTITQPSAALSASISSNNPVLCFGGNSGSLEVTATGGTFPYTYAWSNGQTSASILNLSSGTYTVTVTDANGCTTIQSATVTQPSAALNTVANATQQVFCNGGADGIIDITVTGGTAPYSYNWSNGSTSEDLSGLAAGTYTVTITDANGCQDQATATITEPTNALSSSITSTQQVNCFAGNNGSIDLTVNGGTSPYTYVWSNGATTQDISGLVAGTYTVSITDANGCTDAQTVVISEPSAALAVSSTNVQPVLCFAGSNGSIDITVAGGTGPYSFNWSNGSTNEDLSGLTAGTYTVTVTDANGCTASLTETIAQPSAALSASTTVTANISCFSGNNGAIDLTVTGGTAPYTFVWSNGSTTEDIAGLSSGTYNVTITDANGCTTSATATISQPAGSLAASLTVSQNVNCFGGSNGALDLTATGGTTPYSYVWSNGATTEDISGLATGVYTVTVTDANGCIASQSALISQPTAALSATSNNVQPVLCFAGTNGAIDITVAGGTTPYSYNWSNGATTEDITGLAAGTYTVTITDANGCTATLTETISQPAAALTSAASVTSNVSCFSGSNGGIDLTVNGGTAPYSYNWSNGSTSEDLSGLAAGTYTVTITDANGCQDQATATITEPSNALSSSITSTQQVNCFAGNNGSIDLTVNGGTSPYNYVWSNGATTQDISGLVAGTYTVSITDANGCTDAQTVVISEPSAALAVSSTNVQPVLCFAGSNGSIDITVTGGTAPYSFNWSNGATSEDQSGLTAGSYTVTVTDANGCTATLTETIAQPSAALAASTTVTANISCFSGNNGAIDLTVTGGTAPYTFVWSNGSTTEDITGLSSGTYNVTITDANGCIENATATISQPAGSLAASLTVSQNVNCFGGNNGALDLSVNGGTIPYSFVWSNGATTEDISGLATGVYTVTVTDANGCIASQSALISQPTAALSATSNNVQPVLCFTGTNGAIDITVAGGTTPYSYNWSNGATTEDISGLAAGTYTVTITDANGCTATLTETISQPAAALSATGVNDQEVNCFAGADGAASVVVTGGTSPYTYLWSNGEITQAITGLIAGTYSVTVTDINGCTTNASVVISEPSASLSAALTSSQNVNCFGGNNGAIDITVTGGTAPYVYAWSNGSTTEDLSGLAAGTYSVTITDVNACTTTLSATIAEPVGALNVSVAGTIDIACFAGDNGAIDITVVDGTAPYTYIWSNGSVTEDLTDLAAGTYTVTVTDANGCTGTQSITLNQPAAALNATAITAGNISCFSGNNGSIDVTVTGGTAPYSFMWNNGAVTEDLSALAAGTYTVSITDANGCVFVTSATITQPAGALTTSLSIVQNVQCFAGADGSLDLTASGGTLPYTFNWSNGATTEDISNLAAGTYTVTVTDSNGCISSQTATISQPVAALAATIAGTQNVNCFGDLSGNIDITVSGGTQPYTFVWSNGATSEDLSNIGAGTYTVSISDANGCTESLSVTISQPAASLSANAQVTANVSCNSGANGSIDLTVNGGTIPYTYSWNNGAVTEDLNGITAGLYIVTVTDANGCIVIDSAEVTEPVSALNSTISSVSQVNCFAGNDGSIDITVSGGTIPYSFAWSNGATSEDLANLAAGTYTVTVTDANGCTTQNTATISQPVSALAATITSSSNVGCNGGADGSADITVTGGTAPYTYNWSNGQSTEDLNGLVAGIYTVTITDANGCTESLSVTITEPSNALAANAVVTQQVNCFADETGAIDLTVSGGTLPYTYNWSNGFTTEDLSQQFAGTYSVVVTDANGCTADAQATITQPSSPLLAMVNVVSNVFCSGGTNGALDLTVNGGTAPYTFVWSNGATTEDISNLGTGVYTVTVTDANGCTSMASGGIGQPSQQLNAVVSVVQNVLCFNGNNGFVDINVTGGTAPYTFIWSNGATTEDIGGLVAGVYSVTITDVNGCTANLSATVIQPQAPLIPSVTVVQKRILFWWYGWIS
ncbi:MAG: SprB repeat-containing protein [Bacteroidetes bacterium]|nr:SprB repeat-containing protein [Bacteroidota bacterium]